MTDATTAAKKVTTARQLQEITKVSKVKKVVAPRRVGCRSRFRNHDYQKRGSRREARTCSNSGDQTGRIDYVNNQIIDSGCSNHMIGDIKKLEDLEQYKESQVIVTTNNSKLPIIYICKTRIYPSFSPQHIQLERVYHILGMKKNLLSVTQLIAQANYVLFRHKEMKIYRNLKNQAHQ